MEPGRSRALVFVAAVVAIALGITVIVVALTREDDDPPAAIDTDPATTVTTAAGTAEEAPAVDELDAAVAEISAFVAEERALPFKRPVEVSLLAADAVAARMREDVFEDLEEIATTEAVLGALDLLPDDLDLAETLSSFLGDSVVGFYDPETDELVLRGTALTPYVRSTLAHELTHALDDQHFELERPALEDADDESGVGFAALVEGNAVRVQEAYEQTLSGSELDELRAEEAALAAGIDISRVPPVLPQLIGFPYSVGPRLVDALRGEGGEQRVNDAFTEPPTTSEQVLDPAAWLAGRAAPVPVPPPPADGEVFDQGAVGALGLVVLLQDELGSSDANRAADGWGGDWYVAWRDGDDTCVRTTVVMDTAVDLDELSDALQVWAASHDDASVEETTENVTFKACG